MKIVHAVVAFAAVATPVIGAQAAGHDRPVVVTGRVHTDPALVRHVAIGDLNLASPAGRASMTRRVSSAANELCGGRATYDVLSDQLEERACVTATIATAREQMDVMIAHAGDQSFAARGVAITLASR